MNLNATQSFQQRETVIQKGYRDAGVCRCHEISYNELVGRGGWDGPDGADERAGELEDQKVRTEWCNLDGCPLAKHLRKGFVLPDTVGTSTPLVQSATSFL